MSRSPLAYPLNRSADMDIGGAADLQTDVMRFMAILALCLVAIFALVQSIPLTPVEPQPVEELRESMPPAVAESLTQPIPKPLPRREMRPEPASTMAKPVEETIVLTRPKWIPKYKPPIDEPETGQPALTDTVAAPAMLAKPTPVAAPVPAQDEGFTLRFASDAALMRSVAAHKVGVYAIDAGRARRMTVSESRISFWDASTPNTFHEMEAETVPDAVANALERAGVAPGAVQWGVTLPGRMTAQLDELMQEHRGGDLVIGAAGNISWESSR
jgi:hypothetical protein